MLIQSELTIPSFVVRARRADPVELSCSPPQIRYGVLMSTLMR